MKKTYLISSILFAVFVNVLLFAIPSEYTGAFWVAYAFLMALIVVSSLVCILDKKIKVHKYGSYFVDSSLVFIAFIIAIIFKFIEKDLYWIPLIIDTAFVLIVVSLHLYMKDADKHISVVENNIKEKRAFISDIKVDLELLMDTSNDEKKQQLKKLYYLVVDSDPISIEKVYDLEDKIKDKIDELKISTEYSQLISEITLLFNERNKKMKAYK